MREKRKDESPPLVLMTWKKKRRILDFGFCDAEGYSEHVVLHLKKSH